MAKELEINVFRVKVVKSIGFCQEVFLEREANKDCKEKEKDEKEKTSES